MESNTPLNFVQKNSTLITLIFIVIISAGALMSVLTSKKSFEEKIATLEQERKILEEAIIEKDDQLSALTSEKESLSETLSEKDKTLAKYSNEIEDLEDEKENLEKLAELDPELLQKYSKVFFLNEHYTPPSTESIPKRYILRPEREEEIHEDVYDFLIDMLEEAEDDDVPIKIVSAFRSFDRQAELKNQYTVVYGAGSANQFSADQGYSEHQLGTTVDFTSPTLGGLYTSFENTEAFKWLEKNAHKYGFILSYPKGNSYYQYEPWHWRFVGVELARELYSEDEYFYDWEQRAIDKYLLQIFD